MIDPGKTTPNQEGDVVTNEPTLDQQESITKEGLASCSAEFLKNLADKLDCRYPELFQRYESVILNQANADVTVIVISQTNISYQSGSNPNEWTQVSVAINETGRISDQNTIEHEVTYTYWNGENLIVERKPIILARYTEGVTRSFLIEQLRNIGNADVSVKIPLELLRVIASLGERDNIEKFIQKEDLTPIRNFMQLLKQAEQILSGQLGEQEKRPVD